MGTRYVQVMFKCHIDIARPIEAGTGMLLQQPGHPVFHISTEPPPHSEKGNGKIVFLHFLCFLYSYRFHVLQVGIAAGLTEKEIRYGSQDRRFPESDTVKETTSLYMQFASFHRDFQF